MIQSTKNKQAKLQKKTIRHKNYVVQSWNTDNDNDSQ